MEFVRRVLRALRRSAPGRPALSQRGDAGACLPAAGASPASRPSPVRSRPAPPPPPQRTLPRGDPRDEDFMRLLREVDAFVQRSDDDWLAEDADAFLERPQTGDRARIFAELARLAERSGQAGARQRPPANPPPVYRPRAHPGAGSTKSPEQRGIDLLNENLTPAQRRQFAFHRHFDVIGQSGRRYRLWHRPMQNIEEFDANGERVCVWCFHPRQPLVLGDVLLAQKTALELFEADALRVAHRYSDFAAYGITPPPPRLREPTRRIS